MYANNAMKQEVVVTQTYNVWSAPNFTFDNSPGQKTSTWQYSGIVKVPPVGNRKCGTLKWLCHNSPVFTRLHACRPLFTVLLRPMGGGEPGCEGPFIAACSFNHHLCFFVWRAALLSTALMMVKAWSRNYNPPVDLESILLWSRTQPDPEPESPPSTAENLCESPAEGDLPEPYQPEPEDTDRLINFSEEVLTPTLSHLVPSSWLFLDSTNGCMN